MPERSRSCRMRRDPNRHNDGCCGRAQAVSRVSPFRSTKSVLAPDPPTAPTFVVNRVGPSPRALPCSYMLYLVGCHPERSVAESRDLRPVVKRSPWASLGMTRCVALLPAPQHVVLLAVVSPLRFVFGAAASPVLEFARGSMNASPGHREGVQRSAWRQAVA